MRILLSILLGLIIGAAQSQTIRIVDNNFNAPTGPLTYGTIQEALNAAVAGDTIYIQPSPNTYGNAVVEIETITLMGIGFDLTKDLPYTSNMGDIILRNNNDNTSDASGATILGLAFVRLFMAEVQTGNYTLSDVTVENCRFNYLDQNGDEVPIDNLLIKDCQINQWIDFDEPLTNTLIRNNLFREFSSLALSIDGGPNTVTITNNIFYGYLSTNNDSDNIVIDHNNFIGENSTSYYSFNTLKTDLVTNNIFYGRSPRANSTNYSNIFNNNLAYETSNNTLPPTGDGGENTGSDNIEGMSPDFVNVDILNSWSSGYDFTLNTGSPAIDAGSDGTDIGITGGAYPWGETNFKLDTSPLPTIESFNTTTIINPGDDLPVQIKAKGN